MAGGLDFSNIARSIGTMVQGMAGRLIPGATLVTPSPSAAANVSSTTPSTGGTATAAASAQSSGTTPRPTSEAGETDMMTEQMLGGQLTLVF